MTDTNGNVAAAHLGSFAGYPVSLAILPDLRAAAAQFHEEGYTFSLVRGFPGYRDWGVQGAMQRAFDAGEFGIAPYYLSGAKGTRPDNPGHGRHGFGRAIDVTSNAPLARRDAILAAHGFHLWKLGDRNHYEWGNVLTPADVSSIPITNQEDDMAGAGLYGLFSRTDAGVTTLAIGSLTPGYETHDNYWAEAPESSRADWEAMFGPARDLRTDVWNVRSNDPKRISDLSKFPFIGGATPSATNDPSAVLAAIAALSKQESTYQAALLTAIGQVDENTLATFGLKRV